MFVNLCFCISSRFFFISINTSCSFKCQMCHLVCKHCIYPTTLWYNPNFLQICRILFYTMCPIFLQLYILFSSVFYKQFKRHGIWGVLIFFSVPGDWLEWSDWSRCSATCGTGIRWRTRDCNMTSYGDLTAPCEGTSNGTEDCNTFPCRPYGKTIHSSTFV